jgi:hypothetical protein
MKRFLIATIFAAALCVGALSVSSCRIIGASDDPPPPLGCPPVCPADR